MKTKTYPAKLTISPKIYMEAHFNAVLHYLSFGVSVPYNMKKEKVTNERITFVKKTLEYSAKHPQLIPGYQELPLFQKDKQMEKDLKMFASDANETLGKISALNGKVDYLAYAYAIAFMENVKVVADKKINLGVKVYSELKKQFSTELAVAA